ncbi:MAG: exodeoxyribonuclease VII large subunit [Opitutales bacterium]|nr:exodeoxyribonuclease VII large subunit [Opitutales bacterium]
MDFFEENAGTSPDDAPFTVTEFTRRIKALVENTFGGVWIRGEVSNLRIQSSGHAYFTLKDAGAQLAAVAFRGTLARAGTRLREGMQIVVFGQISIRAAR